MLKRRHCNGVSLARQPGPCGYDACRDPQGDALRKPRTLQAHPRRRSDRACFRARSIVAPGAQKTDGKMMSPRYFPRPTAPSMYNKPELEIFADDVVCGHGATVGLSQRRTALLPAGPVASPRKRLRLLLLEAFRGGSDRRCRHGRDPRSSDTRWASAWGDGCDSDRTVSEMLDQPTYDVALIRADFPALTSVKPYGKPLVYLDNAASVQKPRAVIERMVARPTSTEYANVHRGLHYLANAATDAYRGGARAGPLLPQCWNPSMRSSSRARRPRSINLVSSFLRLAERISARATRSCSPSWSTMPISCPGISMRERQGRGAQLGRHRRRGQLLDRRAFEQALTRGARSSSPSRICRTCSARSPPSRR